MTGFQFLVLGLSIFANISYEILAEIQNRYYDKVEQIVAVAALRQRARSSIDCSSR